jgi:hypothetical protein
MSATRIATLRGDVPSDRQQASSGLSATTLMIASASSVAAALVVSRIWGPGTLIGAATTPVIVTLVSEALRRPATVISTVRETRSGRFDPVAEGRAGLREGDLEQARSPIPAAAVAERRVHRASGGVAGGRGGSRLRLPRPRVIAAVATGLVAFVVAGVFLTGSELVLGKSVVSSSKRTTYIPVHRSTPSSTTKDKTDTTKSDTTTTTTPTTTTAPTQTQPPPAATTPTAPPAQAAPPPATTAPPAGTPPATTAPAPQSAPPPPATTP